MTKLKTLKNLEKLYDLGGEILIREGDEFDRPQIVSRAKENRKAFLKELKAEAIKWVKEIDYDIKKYYTRLRRRTKKNTDVTNAQRWHLRKWIINFFNLTEEDLKDEN